MRKCSSFMCVLVVLLAGGAEARREISSERIVGVVAFLGVQAARAWKDCRRFDEIYADGQELCEVMWGEAFKYEPDEDKAYTMWWYEAENPNDAVTRALGMEVPDTCELEYFHKSAPSPEGPGFTECHPWHASSCCHDATTETPEKLKMSYGEGYEWDRCGPISQACERFFVMESCLYECSPNAGLYRRYTDSQLEACTAAGYVNGDFGEPYEGFPQTVEVDGEEYNCTGAENTWELYRMPIKASFCDAWFRACREDSFCGTGDYFSCATDYHKQLALNATRSPPPPAPTGGDDDLPGWAIAVIVICVVLVMVCGACIILMVCKERKGAPIFTPVEDEAKSRTDKMSKGTEAAVVSSAANAEQLGVGEA